MKAQRVMHTGESKGSLMTMTLDASEGRWKWSPAVRTDGSKACTPFHGTYRTKRAAARMASACGWTVVEE